MNVLTRIVCSPPSRKKLQFGLERWHTMHHNAFSQMAQQPHIQKT